MKALAAEEHGTLEKKKPPDVYRLLFENVNRLGVFRTGKARNRKIRQLRHILKEWEIDIASLAETQADWRYVSEERQFDMLFGIGRDRRSIAASNRTVPKQHSPRNQRGGVAMMTVGRALASVKKVDCNPTNLSILLDRSWRCGKDNIRSDSIHAT